MIPGMSLAAFTVTHVVISIIGILVGLVVVGSMLRAAPPHRLTVAFLITTFATSATGFFFPPQAFQKIPALKALAPTGSEPPFIIAQLVLLAVFCVIGLQTMKRFHPHAAPAVLA